ncbi:[citrate (pro-3S)-lyase] ligase [Anaerosolibacter sp.]|uniref:[citrate (pro-3S)-lyase] ligase n=1 Tax=Anaerosolibacter sp. TaxID=1872527 RepID=UPI0039EFA08E
MEFEQFTEYRISLNNKKEVENIKAFLALHGLQLDSDVEYTVGVFDGERLVATGSICGKVLKCIAVDKEYQGLGIANKLVSHLIHEEYQRGNTHLFIFTKPENYTMFYELGFHKIAEVPNSVMLMENHPAGIKNFIEEIKKQNKSGQKISAVIMNCNPFTLGHLYLIEKAARESDILHIFVVWEERSSFPAEVRYRLIEEGTKHLSNIVLHKGKDYIISSATFPTYFIKEYQRVVEIHASLDLEIFRSYIAPALGITKRFIGEEPYCPVTRTYNRIMKEYLPQKGIEVVEIPRLHRGENAISASQVRRYIREGDVDKTQRFVPKTTYEFLTSVEAEPIIEMIQRDNRRH